MRHPLVLEAEVGRSIATEAGFVVNSPRYDAPADSRNPDRPYAGVARRTTARPVRDGSAAKRNIRFATGAVFVRHGPAVPDVPFLRLALRNLQNPDLGRQTPSPIRQPVADSGRAVGALR